MNDDLRQRRIDYIAQELIKYLYEINGTNIGNGFYFKLVPLGCSLIHRESDEELSFCFEDTGGEIIVCTLTIHPSGRSEVLHLDVEHLTQSLIINFNHPKFRDPFPYKWEAFKLEKDDHEKILHGKGVCESLKYAIFHFMKYIHDKLYSYM